MQNFVVFGDRSINMNKIWYVHKIDNADREKFAVRIYFAKDDILGLKGDDAVEFWERVAPNTTFQWG